MLYLLFPKGDIESLIQGEHENTNLSINYLESMLLYHPDNVDLQMLLIQNYRYKGELEKASQLNDKLIATTTKKELLKQLYQHEYLILKEKYFQLENNPEEQKSLIKIIRKKLYAYYDYDKEKRDYLFFFAESTQMDFQKLKYLSLNGLMKQRPDLVDYRLQKEVFFLAITLKDKEKAYHQLLNLLDYEEVEIDFKESALTFLLENRHYKEATPIAVDLFVNNPNKDKMINFFKLALYSLINQNESDSDAIEKLVQLYQENKALVSNDIANILTMLIQIGEVEIASNFAITTFKSHQEQFSEEVIAEAIKTLIFTSQLEPALEISLYAYEQFPSTKWLDNSIQLSTWLGETEEVVALNEEGYRCFKDKKYEAYLLSTTTLNDAYKVLERIYKNRVESGDFSLLPQLVEYFNYTGEVAQAEAYFTKLLKHTKNKELHKQTIIFSYHNSNYHKGLRLYKQYQQRYGIDKELQQLSIDKLIALKSFEQSYKLSKELEAFEKNADNPKLADMAWLQKDYNYIYKKLWEQESNNTLNSVGYEKLITLEKAFNPQPRIEYLYQKSWRKTSRVVYIMALLYYYTERKDYKSFRLTLKEEVSSKIEKKLEKSTHYLILVANYYAQTSKHKKALQLFKKALKTSPKNRNIHETYLWFLLDNRLHKELKKEINFLEKNPKLQAQIGFPSVVGAIEAKKRASALRWLRKLLKEDNNNKEYKKLYANLKNQSYNNEAYSPKNLIGSKVRHLSPKISLFESHIEDRWRLYKGVEAKLSLTNYQYYQENKKRITDNTLALSLKNSNKSFLWNFELAKHFTNNDFISSSLKLDYTFNNLLFKLHGDYQKKADLTPKLQLEAMENTVQFSLSKPITERNHLELMYKKSQYRQQDGTKLGTGEKLQLTNNHTLRSGYPSVAIANYISLNRYDFLPKTFLGLRSFNEIGSQLAIGTVATNQHYRSWRPFGSIGVAISEQNSLGTTFSFGFSGMLRGRDKLNLLFDYSKGMDTISEPLYGFHLEYLF